MPLWKVMLGCVVLAALVGLEEDLALFMPVAIVWLGVILGVRLRPSLSAVRAERRLPRLDEGGAVLLGLAGAFLTLIALGVSASGIVGIATGRDGDSRDALDKAFWLITVAMPTAPLWHRIVTGAADRPLRPLAAGLLATAPLGLGLGVFWLGWIDEFSRTYSGGEDVLFSIVMIPLCALLIGFAGSSIVRSLHEDSAVRPVFRATMTIAFAAWTLVAMALVIALLGIAGAGRLLENVGGIWAAVFGIVTALAWMIGLWRARTLPVDRTLPLLVILAMLIVAFPLSQWGVSYALQSDSTWVDFAALLATPFVLVTAALCAFAAPSLVKALSRLGGPRSDPASAAVPSRQA